MSGDVALLLPVEHSGSRSCMSETQWGGEALGGTIQAAQTSRPREVARATQSSLPAPGSDWIGDGETSGCLCLCLAWLWSLTLLLPVLTGLLEPASQPLSSAVRTGCGYISRRTATTGSVASVPSTKVGGTQWDGLT